MKKGIDYIGVAVCFMCHDGKGNFLFTRRGPKARDEQGKWEVPAGGVEVGETVEAALHRELKEELCVEPKVVEYIGHREHIAESEEGARHWIVFSYLVEVDPEEVKIGEPDTCDGLHWSPLEEAPEPMHLAMRDSIIVVQNHLRAKTELL